MNENKFNALRTIARERRDKALAEIQADYAANILAIGKLEQSLCGKRSNPVKQITAIIESAIPADKSFTTDDLLAALEAKEPGRAWRKKSLNNYISRLRCRGVIKRLSKASGTEPAVYVRAEVGPEHDSRPLGDYIGEVLVRPMTATEVTLAILEAGFKSRMPRHAIRKYVASELKARGYRRSGERWDREVRSPSAK